MQPIAIVELQYARIQSPNIRSPSEAASSACRVCESLGCHRLDDVLAIVKPRFLKERPGKPLTRTSLYRAMLRLRELGLDPGPDDRSTARRLGRPTRGKKTAAGKVIGDLHHQDVQEQVPAHDYPARSPVDDMNGSP